MVLEIDKNDKTSDNNFDEPADSDDVVFEEEGDEDAPTFIRKLRERLKTCQSERDAYLAGWQRAKADFVNARRNEVEERERFAARAVEGVVAELLPAIDSFDMAFQNHTAWESAPVEWRKGVEYIYDQLIAALERSGVTILDPQGELFDPGKHTSIVSVQAEKAEDDHRVIEVMQKGYVLNGKIIRPASVKIAIYEQVLGDR